MSQATGVASTLNSLLDPFLFQVIGSTPGSLAKTLSEADIKGDPTKGLYLACVATFAVAVNKPTVESFAARPELAPVRAILATALSVGKGTNMTALTMLGHCLLTTKHLDGVTFVQEFRNKMGQDHLWAGNLSSGSLSEKQKKILEEKKRTTNQRDATLLGSCYFKFTGLDPTPMTREEEAFFYRTATVPGLSQGSGKAAASPPDPASGYYAAQTTIPASMYYPAQASSASTGSVPVVVSGSETVMIPKDVYDRYMSSQGATEQRLAASIQKRGLEEFLSMMRKAMATGSNLSMGSGGTTV